MTTTPIQPPQNYGTANDMSSFLLGAVIERVYYTVPQNDYVIGPEFSKYLDAVTFAQQEVAIIRSGARGELAKAEVEVVTRISARNEGATHDFQIGSLTVKG